MGICHGDGLLGGRFGIVGTHCGGTIVMCTADLDVVSVDEQGASYVRVMCEIRAATFEKRVIEWLSGRGTVKSLSRSKRA